MKLKKKADKKNQNRILGSSKLLHKTLKKETLSIDDKTDLYFIILGIFLFIIWLIDLIQKLRFYNQYEYLWFCSIAVLFLSIGCLLRSRTFILSFLPIAFIAQLPWIIDYFLLILGHNSLTNTANYMFDNGQTLIEFIISLKHLFIIPIALFTLVMIKKPIKKYYWIITIIIGYSILILSPILPVPNINCVSYNCFSNLPHINDISRFNPDYYIIVVIFTTIFGLTLGHLIYRLLNKSEKIMMMKKLFKMFIIILFYIAFIGALVGIIKYFSIPHYLCLNEKSDIYCEKAYTKNLTTAYFTYHIFNKMGDKCNITVYSDDKILTNVEQKIYENPGIGYIYLPKPKINTKVLLRARCDNI